MVTLSLVAASFFFLGHWLDLASAGGGGRIQAAQEKPTPYDAVSKAVPLETVPRPLTGEEAGGGSEL